MWIAIGLLILAGDTVWGALIGENVCQEERRYTLNVTEYFLRNSTIRNYEWCLNVPPRCSFYTTRLINDSRIVEKEITDVMDKCCSGYTEDKETNRCVPFCPDCFNGTCIDGKCACFPGYKGEHCHIGCESSEWGKDCQYQCKCNGGSCHPETGNCICLPGWTGDKCHVQCTDGFYGLNCQHSCKCSSDSCNPINGECESTSITPHSTDSTSHSSSSPDIKSTTASIPKKIEFANNGKFETDKNGLLSTTELGPTETPFPFYDDEDKDKSKIGQILVNNYMSASSGYGSTSGPVAKSKGKVKDKEAGVIDGEENYLSDDAHGGNPEVNQKDLVNGASAATAISAGIIIVAAVIVAANHFKRNKEKPRQGGAGNKGVSTLAVYTHSIFHTPLPEPPTFETPVFTSPVDSNPANEGRFETHVVCSMNFPTHSNTKDPRDYLYDHPPSTGSYRAASIPEPPDIDISQLTIHSEPLYDEIPSGMAPTPISQPPPSYKSSSLYMNTCGKTRF